MKNKVRLIIAKTCDFDFDTIKELPFITSKDVLSADKFANKEDKTLRLVSAYLKRKYVGKWEVSENGKPVCDGKFFNVSHCSGAVALALSDNDVGIDIEKIRPVADNLKAYVAAQDELARIFTEEDFFKVWTAKESLVKAEGSGLKKNVKDIPAFPLSGLKKYGNSYYYSQFCLYDDMVVSITRSGETPFEILVETETLEL